MTPPAAFFVATPIILALTMNLVIYMRGWNAGGDRIRTPGLPPGWIIGSVWVVLLGLLGYATYLAFVQKERVLVALLVVLMAQCITYPLYTGGLRKQSANVGNVGALINGFVVALVAARRVPCAVPYLVPLLVWASYVNVVTAVDTTR
jgi:tryptophan-rich sensory protein